MQMHHAFGLATFGFGVMATAFVANLVDLEGSGSLGVQVAGAALLLAGIVLFGRARKEVAVQ